jgi:hypothetical protein
MIRTYDLTIRVDINDTEGLPFYVEADTDELAADAYANALAQDALEALVGEGRTSRFLTAAVVAAVTEKFS